jgi:hypothetical protein
MSEHTPGPWTAEETDKGRLRVVSKFYADEEPGICGDHSKAWRLCADDARLIAAAPDLLAALAQLLEHSETMNSPSDEVWHSVRDLARYAIAKAERG